MCNKQFINLLFAIWTKRILFMVSFGLSFIFCYSQNNQHFEWLKQFYYPTALRISVIEKDHWRTSSIEEILIYSKSISDSTSVFKIHIYTQNYNVPKYCLDTLFYLNSSQILIIDDYCDFIYRNNFPDKYHGEAILPEASGVSYTYIMEIAEKRYSFTDNRILSLTTLLLFDKPNWLYY